MHFDVFHVGAAYCYEYSKEKLYNNTRAHIPNHVAPTIHTRNVDTRHSYTKTEKIVL